MSCSSDARADDAADAPAATAAPAAAGTSAPQRNKPARRPPLSGKKKPDVKPLPGSVQIHGGWYTLRVRVGGQQRRIKLYKVGEVSEAKAREKGAAWLERMAREQRQAIASTRALAGTFQNIGERWTSGELARTYPDHVKPKKTAGRDAERLAAHVYPLVGNKLVADFTLDDAEKVMQALPRKTVRTPATRRHYAQLIHRILGLAVFPLRLIKVNPLPKGFLPKVGPAKAKGWLYPDEDAKLCGATVVPLCSRLLYGFLNREGPRLSEAAALDLSDVDLERGAVRLDENKTDDPRAWALDPGVVRGLRAWIAHREALAGAPLPRKAPLFLGEDGERIRGDDFHAKRFRAHLQAAGIDHVELFERSASRMHIRLHDTRATFVTLALANGKTETWVADRTGHKSSDMINKYRRAARTAAELGLGPLRPLDEVLPELAVRPPPAHEGGGADGSMPPAADPISGAAARAQACAHADLNVANRGVPSPEPHAELDVSQQPGASLNPLIMVRVHAPELGVSSDRAVVGHSGGGGAGKTERSPAVQGMRSSRPRRVRLHWITRSR